MKKIKDLETRWKNHLMTIAAFRYCLGKQSYIALECVEWLDELWKDLPVATKDQIIEEIESALERNTAGDMYDNKCWKSLLGHVAQKPVGYEHLDWEGK